MKTPNSCIYAAVIFLLTVLGCGELRRQATRESTPDFEISADQLAREFNESPTAADIKYTGRTLAVTGRVDGKVLGTSIVFVTDRRQHGFIIQCFFDKDDADDVKKIENKQEVTILGVCRGRDTNDGPLMITQCMLR